MNRLSKTFAFLSLLGFAAKDAPAQDKIGETKTSLSLSTEYTGTLRQARQWQAPFSGHAEVMQTFKLLPLFASAKGGMMFNNDKPLPQNRPEDDAGKAMWAGQFNLGVYAPLHLRDDSYFTLRGAFNYNFINAEKKNLHAPGAEFKVLYTRGHFSAYTSISTQFLRAGKDTSFIQTPNTNAIQTGKVPAFFHTGISYTISTPAR
jgi:hypothetical protein